MPQPICRLILIALISSSVPSVLALTIPSLQKTAHDGIFQSNALKSNSEETPDCNGDRRSFLSRIALTTSSIATATIAPSQAQAVITEESNWPLWTALPVAPFNRRRTIRYEVGPGVYAFDQMIGIYYVHVPIRMSVMAVHQNDPSKRGLVVYAPVAPTKECLSLLQELIDQYGPVRDIIDPSTAVEHKVNAGPLCD